jgi:sigma-70-like protein
MLSSPADQELLSAAARGDQAAFGQIYQRYRNRVYGFAYRMLGTQEAAEDVTHEAFLLLIRQPEVYQAARGLKQTAIVNKNRLIFWINGAQYEWISKSRIVPADGSFHVWMKFDPTLTEQINDGTRWSVGASDTLPGEKKEE